MLCHASCLLQRESNSDDAWDRRRVGVNPFFDVRIFFSGARIVVAERCLTKIVFIHMKLSLTKIVFIHMKLNIFVFSILGSIGIMAVVSETPIIPS